MLAGLSIIMRILWVADVVNQVKVAVTLARSAKEDGGGGGSDTTNVPSDDATTEQLDKQVIQTLSLQATLIGLLCMFAWASCVLRAVRLRNAVAHYRRVSTVPERSINSDDNVNL